ncbi:MAG: hypothetical protein GY842_07185 [bacterium]|nr:hypothetical protein [bacterium]
MSDTVYLNGQFVPSERATVSIYDGGWMHGAGLFETMRAHRGIVFRLDAHLDRLMTSAAQLLFPLERPDLPLTQDFERLLVENRLVEARVRLTVSAGSMQEPLSGDRPAFTVCVTAAQRTTYPETAYEQGVAVAVSRYRQSGADPVTGHKTTNYLARLLALREAQQQHCSEALWFTPENLLAEGSISNIFVVKESVLKTPPLSTPVLPGITREAVLEIGRRANMAVEEAPLTINDVLDADEVFITNSGMEIMPVVRVERRDIGTGKPGEATRDLIRRYQALLEEECAPS